LIILFLEGIVETAFSCKYYKLCARIYPGIHNHQPYFP
jgi:hypothetical protein